MSRKKIFEEINAEREYQDGRWGTASDDKNNASDFQMYINNQFCRGFSYTGDLLDNPRKALVNAAAIAVAAIETFDRNNGLKGCSLDE